MTKKKAKRAESPPVEPADRRRHELLDAAFQLVAEKGLEGLRTRDIAAKAGVNISTLHYYFDTKDTLVGALVEYAIGQFLAPHAERPETDDLREHFATAARSFEETPQLSAVLLELGARAHREPAARAVFRESHAQWNLGVERILRASIKNRTVRADVDPKLAAVVVTSTIIGAMVELGVNAKAFDFAKVTSELVSWLEP